jgi:hypothetical protein
VTSTDSLPCINQDGAPAATLAVLTHKGTLRVGIALCAACSTCTDTTCGELGTILDIENAEPWCTHHARQFTGDDAITGPELVPVDEAASHDTPAGQQ